MTSKWYFVPKESHARTLRGLTSAVGTQLHHLFWQEPAALLSASQSFALAVSFLPFLKSRYPVWPLFPWFLFPTPVLPTKTQVEVQCGYETEANNDSSKQIMRSQALGTEPRVLLMPGKCLSLNCILNCRSLFSPLMLNWEASSFWMWGLRDWHLTAFSKPVCG